MKRPSPLLIGLALLSAGLASVAIGFAGVARGTPPQLSTFQTPSGNIACQIYDDTVRCEIRERDYGTPAKPAGGCENSAFSGNNITMPAGSAPHFSCASDTVLDSRLPVLPYGASTTVGRIQCSSETTHVYCEADNGRRSFQLAREGYRL